MKLARWQFAENVNGSIATIAQAKTMGTLGYVLSLQCINSWQANAWQSKWRRLENQLSFKARKIDLIFEFRILIGKNKLFFNDQRVSRIFRLKKRKLSFRWMTTDLTWNWHHFHKSPNIDYVTNTHINGIQSIIVWCKHYTFSAAIVVSCL